MNEILRKKISSNKIVTGGNSVLGSKQGMLKLVNIIVAQDMRCFYLYPIKNLPAVNGGREICMFFVEKCFAKN